MIWLVLLLCLAVVALALLVAVTRNRLRTQAELTAAADRRGEERSHERDVADAALEQCVRERLAAEERVAALAAERATAEDTARAAEERATAAESAIEQARREVDEARAEVIRVEEVLRNVEERSPEAARSSADGLDAEFLWALERSRSERTWRQSVALGPDEESVLDAAENVLVEAIRIDLEAAREEVGLVVDLDADLPGALTAAGSVLALRAAQELLASVVRRSESIVVRLRADGDDVIVTVDAVDLEGDPVMPPPLAASWAVSPVDGGVRVHGALAPNLES